MALSEALYGRRCRSMVGWFELEQLRTLQSRQKIYADRKVYDVSYMVWKKVLLKVSPMKGVMRFGKKGKLSPRFIGPFKKYVSNPSHVLDLNTVQLDSDMTYDLDPVAILDRQVRKLRSKDIVFVKVQWRGQLVKEATWETELEMRSRYPHLFVTPDLGVSKLSSRVSKNINIPV
ncbi:uncharacterized protein [Nicotiana sylvestris]|uniref:uncharacterized protein n=1 Tax=Nicotiana sylvestris TaxID=4096 RepID=UPI00388CC9D7